MKILKLILTVSAAAVVMFSAHAGQQATTLNGGTNNIAAASTNTIRTTSVAVNVARDTALQVTVVTAPSNVASTNTITFDWSIDNANWMTNATNVQFITSAAYATNTTVYNFPMGGVPYYRIGTFGNSNAAVYFTNVNVLAFTKNGL